MIIKTRLLTITALIYGGMLVYASLMPFDVAWNDDTITEYSHIWDSWPINPRARISGSDVVSNLALYLPLGWLIALRLRIAGLKTRSSAFVSSATCSLLSAIIEVLQLPIISRTCSAADWILNSISGFTGAFAGALWGMELWSAILQWFKTTWEKRPIDIAAIIFAGLLAADALSPYLPTILLTQVWHNIKNAQLNPWTGFGMHEWHWWLITRIAVYAMLTMLLAGWGGRKRPASGEWMRAATLAFGFAVCLEIGKLMIVSRTLNSANIAASFLGSILAACIGRFFMGKISNRLKADLACTAIFLYILYLAWTPFDFVGIPNISEKIDFSLLKLLPFYHYAMGAKLNHARLFVQSVFLMGILVYLLRLRFTWFEKHGLRILIAVTLSALVGAIAEGGQIFLLSRWPTMTDVYCCAIGGYLGAKIKQPSLQRVLQ